MAQQLKALPSLSKTQTLDPSTQVQWSLLPVTLGESDTFFLLLWVQQLCKHTHTQTNRHTHPKIQKSKIVKSLFSNCYFPNTGAIFHLCLSLLSCHFVHMEPAVRNNSCTHIESNWHVWKAGSETR